MIAQTNHTVLASSPITIFLLLVSCIYANAQVRDMYGNSVSSDLCNQLQFDSDKEVTRLVTKILGIYNLDNAYIVGPCSRVSNCVATKDDKGRPYILYNPDFLKKLKVFSFTGSDLPTESEDWGVLLVLSHEIGHHLNNHVTNPHPDLTSRDMELKADETAGYLLYLLNAPDLQTAQKGLRVPQVSEEGSYTHPPRSQRLDAVKKGWDKASERFPRSGPKSTNNDVENKSQCGAYVAPGEWKAFMCHNLGAANPKADPFTPSWEINGGYWQWGVKKMAASGPFGPGASLTNEGEISGWNTNTAANGSWRDDVKTANDPCPPGYRVPTKVQWDHVLRNNPISSTGTWENRPTNYTSGIKVGDKLFLPAAGVRLYGDGALGYRGNSGYYWSSAEDDDYYAWNLNFGSSVAYTNLNDRTLGLSVRCVAE